MTARGIRNNNPGNIRRSDDDWQGLAVGQPDPDFFTFTGPVWGLRALAKILLAYQRKHRLKTIRTLIGRWAPPAENDTGAYVRVVAASCRVHPDVTIDLAADRALFGRLIAAIVAHENGRQPYASALIDEAITRAGVAPGTGAST